MTRPRRRYWPLVDRYQCEVRMEARHVILAVHLTDLQPVQIIEVCALSLALSPKDVNVVIDDATGVTVAAFWDLAGLGTFDPS